MALLWSNLVPVPSPPNRCHYNWPPRPLPCKTPIAPVASLTHCLRTLCLANPHPDSTNSRAPDSCASNAPESCASPSSGQPFCCAPLAGAGGGCASVSLLVVHVQGSIIDWWCLCKALGIKFGAASALVDAVQAYNEQTTKTEPVTVNQHSHRTQLSFLYLHYSKRRKADLLTC